MRQIVIGGAAAGILLALSGCASAGGTPAVPVALDPTSAPSSASATITDEESCEAFGDVSTILQNANMGLQDGRMTQQEYEGWLRLATRVLDRVPTRGEGAVSDGIAALKAVAPAIPAGTIAPSNIDSPEWYAAAPLAEACSAAGYEFFAESFTGG